MKKSDLMRDLIKSLDSIKDASITEFSQEPENNYTKEDLKIEEPEIQQNLDIIEYVKKRIVKIRN